MKEEFPAELAEIGARVVGVPVLADAIIDPEKRQLCMLFESLGQDCEFGLLQRKFGAESLGLFRWAFVTPPKLLELLHNRLDGYGAPANSRVSVAEWGEIVFHDNLYGTSRHTFVHSEGIDLKAFLVKECKRLLFLKDKLLEDLSNGEKIFVYQTNCETTEAFPDQLHRAVSQFGRNRTFVVRIADAIHPAGTVVSDGSGLTTGYIGRLGKTDSGWDIDFEMWIDLLRSTVSLFRGG
jgi:hypothetical protein